MCNKVAWNEDGELVVVSGPDKRVRFQIDKRYNVPPSMPIPIIRITNGELRAGMANFGFPTDRGRQLMAPAETIDQKPMFRHAFRDGSRRCIAVVRGFFDNVDLGKKRQPYFIHRKDGDRMGFACLWEQRADAENLCIVSCEPNRVVRPVIDRMPVILPQHRWAAWLDKGTTIPDLKSMFLPYPAHEMETYAVTPQVNKGLEGPECVERIEPEQGELGIDLFS